MIVLKKVWVMLDTRDRKSAIGLLLLMSLMSLFEVIGIGSIMPFLSVLGNPELINDNEYLNYIYVFFEFKERESFLFFLGGAALVLLFVGAIFRSVASYQKFKFTNLQRHKIGLNLLKRYLQQPYAFFTTRNSSEISKVILSETDLAIQQAILPALNLITFSILSISIILFLVSIDVYLALILSSLFGAFYALMYMTIRKYISTIGAKRNEANSKRFKITQETLGGIKDLKVLGRENAYLNSFIKPSYDYSSFLSINQTLNDVPRFLIEVIAFGALLAMAMFSLTNSSDGIGNLLPILGLYVLGALKLKPAINEVYSSLTNMKFGASALDNVLNDLHNLNTTINIANNQEKISVVKDIKLNNISFKYPESNTFIFENLNLTIEANSTVGIIGPTGAGKSTLVDIILGLLQPTSGCILVDKVKLEIGNTRQWQNSIGYVPQTIFLSDDTIANNIAFGIDDIDIEKVIKVAKMAKVHEFVSVLECQYNTLIGERGVRLSGGQRQRLGIARALYHDPDLIILDEATSALDNETEKEVMKAIDNMAGNKTIIMIAHRLATLNNCDVIVDLDNIT